MPFVPDRNDYRTQQVMPLCDRAFGLAAADQLAVDLEAMLSNGTLGADVLLIVTGHELSLFDSSCAENIPDREAVVRRHSVKRTIGDFAIPDR